MSEVQSTEPETVLQFTLADVMELVVHSLSCTDHIASFSQTEAGEPGAPALEWVKDDGTYLMSNGVPCLEGRDGEANRVVYAKGWGSGTRSELGHTEVGGDDFVEYIGVSEEVLLRLRQASAAGLEWFCVLASESSFKVGFA
jgi:hypothetical protein